MKQPIRILVATLILLLLAAAQGADTISLPAAASDRVLARPELTITTLGFGSCARQDRPQPIWDTINAAHRDAFVLLGDNIYADTSDPAVFREKYAQLAAMPGFAKLRQTTPLFVTWDDHDYGINDGGAGFPGAALAHIRRKWYKAAEESCAEAIWFIGQIRQLYLIEDEVRDRSHLERKAVRRQKAPALWRAMKRRALELKANPRLLPQSSLVKAINYFLNEYTAAVGSLRDDRFEIDNNLVENDVRPSAVGRRRWLCIGHPDAGWRSVVLYTIIQSCRRRAINPQDYLTDVLRRLPSMKNHEVKEQLPNHWKPRA